MHSPPLPYTPNTHDQRSPWSPAPGAYAAPPAHLQGQTARHSWDAAAPGMQSPVAAGAGFASPPAQAYASPVPVSSPFLQAEDVSSSGVEDVPSFGSPHDLLQSTGPVQRRPAAAAAAASTAASNQPRQPPSSAPPVRQARTLTEPRLTPKQFVTELVTPAFVLRAVGVFFALALLLVPVHFLLDDLRTLHAPADESLDVYCSSPPHQLEGHPPLPPWQPHCLACPSHGQCRHGRMTCQDGYFRVHRECVQRVEHTLAGAALKERLITELEAHAGRRVCGDTVTPGAPRADLTRDELQEYVRPFHPTPEQTSAFERAWSYAELFLRSEGTLTQNFRQDNPRVRLITVNEDSRQPLRYRARFPKRDLACRLRQSTAAHIGTILLWAALGTLLAAVAFVARFVYLLVTRSSSISSSILTKLREDYFFDADAGHALRHHPGNILDLKQEFVPQSREATDRLVYQLAWQRVQAAMRRHPHVEEGTHTFQYGPAPSWRWVGPTPKSAREAQGGGEQGSKAFGNNARHDM